MWQFITFLQSFLVVGWTIWNCSFQIFQLQKWYFHMLQDSSLSKRMMNIGVDSYSSKGIVDILHCHWPFSLSCVILLKHCYTIIPEVLFCFVFFTEKCGIESSMCTRGTVFLPHAMFGLKSLPCLEEKMAKLKSDAGFVSDFSGQRKLVGMGVIFILSWSRAQYFDMQLY